MDLATKPRFFIESDPGMELDVILPPKEGAALLVEETTDSVIYDPGSMDDHFARLADNLVDEIPGSSITHESYRARRMRQCVHAVGGMVVALDVLPTMSDRFAGHESLAPPDDAALDPYTHRLSGYPETPDPPLYAKALRGAYWMTHAAEDFFSILKKDSDHPYRRLLHYFRQTYRAYDEISRAHDAKYGEDPLNRPERRESDTDYGYEDDFIGAITQNIGESIDLLLARVLHETDQTREVPDIAGINDIMVDIFAHLRWVSRTDKHSGAKQAEKRGLLSTMIASGAGRLVAEHLVEVQTFDELIEPLRQYRIFADPNFCPTQVLRRGLPLKSGNCPASVNVPIRNMPAQRHYMKFMRDVGVGRDVRPGVFNMITSALAIGKQRVEEVYAPVLVERLVDMQNEGCL